MGNIQTMLFSARRWERAGARAGMQKSELGKGASIYDVRTEGVKKCSKFADKQYRVTRQLESYILMK